MSGGTRRLGRRLVLAAAAAALSALVASGVVASGQASGTSVESRVDSLVSKMTLDEKLEQLQLEADWQVNDDEARRGVGGVFSLTDPEKIDHLQHVAVEQSRLHIPILFAFDTIHGFRTVFPIPLGEASSFDPNVALADAHYGARETAVTGIKQIYSPMVDVSHEPRWGRISEGAGEDPYLGAVIATARVRGFQGNGLGNTDAVMACAKHFAAYGAAIGGRDYNSVDMSDHTLWEIYLPPFKAAADAGAATFMNSFNDLNGIPATGNSYLQRDILKGKWNFKGFVVSDWGSIGEMINHGYAKDNNEAALEAVTAGSDMDMESRSYIDNLSKLVQEGK